MLVLAGWMLGYFHHYHAVLPQFDSMEEMVAEYKAEAAEALASTPDFKRVMVKTTAYSNDPGSINVRRWRDGNTATNKVAKRGHVAADWRIFPPGTKLFIPGYGEAVVEDKGGAVKGYHLDLFVDSKDEAMKWGVKEVPIFVIGKDSET